MPKLPDLQLVNIFEKIGVVLGQVGLNYAAIFEMTTYNIDLRRHFELFQSVRVNCVKKPYPAWREVKVARLRPEGPLFRFN